MPPMVAIRGCNTFIEIYKIVKDFIILNQVVAEKTPMINVHMFYIEVTQGKIKNLKKKCKMRISNLNFHLHNVLCIPKGNAKFHNPKSSSC